MLSPESVGRSEVVYPGEEGEGVRGRVLDRDTELVVEFAGGGAADTWVSKKRQRRGSQWGARRGSTITKETRRR